MSGVDKHLQHQANHLFDLEWFGLYDHPADTTPRYVVQRKFVTFPPIVPHRHLITTEEEFYSVRPHSGTLAHSHAADLGAAVLPVSGFLARIRIVSTTRGQRKLVIHFFYGRVSDLLFDLARLSWTDNVPFLDYSTPKGRDYLRRRHAPLQLAASK
jgi:hypothetical protein